MYRFHHVSLSVTNREESVKFYNQLGFEQVHLWEAEDKSLTITHLKNGDVILELFCFKDYEPAPKTIYSTETDLRIIGTKHFGLKVDSIEKTRENLIIKGIVDEDIEITQGRTGLRYFFIEDPDNILVEIVEDVR